MGFLVHYSASVFSRFYKRPGKSVGEALWETPEPCGMVAVWVRLSNHRNMVRIIGLVSLFCFRFTWPMSRVKTKQNNTSARLQLMF